MSITTPHYYEKDTIISLHCEFHYGDEYFGVSTVDKGDRLLYILSFYTKSNLPPLFLGGKYLRKQKNKNR